MNRPRPAESTVPPHEIQNELLAAIAGSGGWNRSARQRIAAIARRRGLTPRSAVSMLAAIARARAISNLQTAAPANAPLTETAPRPRRDLRRWAALIITLLLIVSTIFLAERLVRIVQRMQLTEVESRPLESQVDADSAADTTAAPSPASDSPALRGTAPNPVITPSRQTGPSVVPPPSKALPPLLAQPVQVWTAQAQQLLNAPPSAANTPEASLARAVQFARMNLAARLLWQSDTSAAARALKSAESTPPTTIPPTLDPSHDPAALTAAGIEPDGVLALELLTLRHQPPANFDSFKHRRFNAASLGPVDCDVAAETALVGSPRELRLIAQRIVADQSDNPAMINALLESLPKASRQSAAAALIAELTGRTLPDTDDTSWPARARIALLERLAELIAPGILPDTDPFSEMIADAYEGRETNTRGQDPAESRHTAEIAAESLWNSMLADAAPQRAQRATALRLDAVIRTHDARAGLARGPLQRFVAAQTSIADLFALIIEAEARSSAASSILQQASAERRAATHIHREIEINERTITLLWKLRLTGTAAEHVR